MGQSHLKYISYVFPMGLSTPARFSTQETMWLLSTMASSVHVYYTINMLKNSCLSGMRTIYAMHGFLTWSRYILKPRPAMCPWTRTWPALGDCFRYSLMISTKSVSEIKNSLLQSHILLLFSSRCLQIHLVEQKSALNWSLAPLTSQAGQCQSKL